MSTTYLTLTSPATQAAAPFSAGVGFKKGDIPASIAVTGAVGYQVDVKRRWSDGSVKHAVISGRAALTANTPLQLNIDPGTPPTGTNLTAADIVSANPQASVQCGTLGTVTLGSLLASPFRTWISGPEVVDCHYRADIPGTLLAVWFFVRLHAGGSCYVRAFVENGYLDNGAGAIAANADISYVPTITIGGTVVYSNGGAALSHVQNTSVMAEGWISGDPQVTPKHDVAYLRASKLVPNYSLSNPNSTTLNALNQTYVPMAQGNVQFGMAAGGANTSIGLLPGWNGMYLGNGDPRALKATLASSSALRSFRICWRDATTKDIIKPTSFPTWSIYGPGQSGDRGANGSNGSAWEINHHPGEGYLAYLLTGDYWHYETMLLQASFIWALRGSTYYQPDGSAVLRHGTSRILVQEVRGTAWTLRTLSILAALAPDADLATGKIAAEYQTVLASNYANWYSITQKPGINPLGYLYEYGANGGLDASVYGVGYNPPWQHEWWMSVNGFASDIEPLADMTNLLYVRDWMYKGIVGKLGAFGVAFPYAYASIYSTNISTGTSLDPTTFRTSWLDVATATFAYLPGGMAGLLNNGALQNAGDPTPAHQDPMPSTGGAGAPTDAEFGRWGYLLPAIAYAVEHGAVGASDSWARVTGATNYTTLTGAGFDQQPQWGIFPRSIGAVQVPTSTTTAGPSFIWDSASLLSGAFVWGTIRGHGLTASQIPSTGTNDAALLYNDIDSVNDPVGTEYRLTMAAPSPASGVFTLNEDSSFSLVGAADGTYTSTESIYKNGVLAYTSPFSAAIGSTTPTVTMVTVSPLTPSVAGGSTQQFSASVIGTNSPAQTVTWTTSGGSINASTGLFAAPAATSSAQTITVTATSTVDTSKSGTATVAVPAVVQTPTVTGVSVLPSTASVGGGGTQQFSATVLGANNPSQGVTWSVASGGGIVNSSGLFTAPSATSSTQTITVRATSTADGTKSGTATITVVALAPTVSSVTVSPGSATLGGFSQQQFSASVTGANNPAQTVTWSVTGGSITTGGLFTAPGSSSGIQTITVRATSSVDGSKSGTATVTIPALAPSVSSVTVSPASGTAQGASQVQFAASVSGLYSPSQAVTWSASAGSITSSGLWTAPSTTVSDQFVTITATSVVDSSKTGQANFTVPAFATPDAPAAVTATAGMETVAVTITVPAYDGGTPITGYIVTASNGQVQNVSGTSATFSIPAFTPVSFTAQAVNVMGAGAASSPSNTVIARPVESTNPADYSLEPAPRGRSMRS